MISVFTRPAQDPVVVRLFENIPPDVAFAFLKEKFTKEDSITLRQMEYVEFLQTQYWRIVRDYVRLTTPAVCVICGRQHRLSLHHQSYDHHGMEHEYLEDLAFFCRDCHEEVHTCEPVKELLRKLLDQKVHRVNLPKPTENPNYDWRVVGNLPLRARMAEKVK